VLILSDFRLHRPASLADALLLRAELGDEAAVYAGGTELLLALKMGVLEYEHLIDIKRCPELRGVQQVDGTVRIGAATTHRDLETSPLLARLLPALAELERHVANIRVRAAGTIGGNLAFAEPHADPPAMLTALDARVELAGAAGVRELAVEDFVLGAYETALGDDELVTAVVVPVPPAGVRATYRKLATLERPTVGVAVMGEVAGDTFATAPAVVVGAVDERPLRVDATPLAGASVRDRDALEAVVEAARDLVDPVDDLSGSADYKRHLTGVVTRRALEHIVDPGSPS
jgi:carbon-monoxide dehydrogenase medium subunit